MIEETDLSDGYVRLDLNETYNAHGADSKASLHIGYRVSQSWPTHFLSLHAIAMERYCHRMTSVRLSVRNVGERWSHTLS